MFLRTSHIGKFTNRCGDEEKGRVGAHRPQTVLESSHERGALAVSVGRTICISPVRNARFIETLQPEQVLPCGMRPTHARKSECPP